MLVYHYFVFFDLGCINSAQQHPSSVTHVIYCPHWTSNTQIKHIEAPRRCFATFVWAAFEVVIVSGIFSLEGV